MQPNLLATFSLAAYPLFIWALFASRRAAVATGLSLIIAEMVLPPGYNLPLSFPTWLGKTSIPPISALIGAFVFRRSYLRRTAPFRGIEVIFLLSMFADLFTITTNGDPLRYGPTLLQGMTMRDFSSDCVRFVFDPWIAFYLGRVMFKSWRDLVMLARMMAIAAAVYTLPILIEIRMSPQFNYWFYGYGTMSVFGMAMRWGGYRPQVFMGNGIVMSMFMLVCTLMAFSLARARQRVAPMLPNKVLCGWLALILVLCKSTGTILYGLVFIPAVMKMRAGRILAVSTLLASVVVLYPVLRLSGLLPMENVGASFNSLSSERAQSLQYRFEMEQKMLNLTQTRPWFGMGGYGRNFVFDRVSGNTETVPDGAVIMTLSSRGLVGYFMGYGPFLLSILVMARRARQIKDETKKNLISALILADAIIMFDLILNATFPSFFIMLVGALNGLVPGIIIEEEEEAASIGAEHTDPVELYAGAAAAPMR